MDYLTTFIKENKCEDNNIIANKNFPIEIKIVDKMFTIQQMNITAFQLIKN